MLASSDRSEMIDSSKWEPKRNCVASDREIVLSSRANNHRISLDGTHV